MAFSTFQIFSTCSQLAVKQKNHIFFTLVKANLKLIHLFQTKESKKIKRKSYFQRTWEPCS